MALLLYVLPDQYKIIKIVWNTHLSIWGTLLYQGFTVYHINTRQLSLI